MRVLGLGTAGSQVQMHAGTAGFAAHPPTPPWPFSAAVGKERTPNCHRVFLQVQAHSEGGEAQALLPRAVSAPSPEVPKARWDGALHSQSWWGQAAHGRGWSSMVFKVPSDPSHSVSL